MPIKPTFTMKQINKYFDDRVAVIDQVIIRKLERLGEECVNMCRDALNISPSAFPVSYRGGSGKPLRQRKLTKQELEKNPGLQQPKFGDYLDQTSNLRNSIGYVVFKDGKVVKSHLGSKSASKSKEVVANHMQGFTAGYGLIVVAGMEYAAFVESKGYNVISSAEVFARSEMPKLIAELKKAIVDK